MDYFHPKQITSPSKGDLLISEPYLPDPNFERTVILLCEHDENGSLGYVLNKPSNVVFDEVIDAVADYKETLFVGGPVQQNTLHFIHRSYDMMSSGKLVAENIYWGGDFEKLISTINLGQIKSKDFRFFLGYSGWSAGQLEEELAAKSWIVYKHTTASLIFDVEEKKLWKEVLAGLGGKFKMFANYPTDPNMN
jgi:putative transcriptional regulator